MRSGRRSACRSAEPDTAIAIAAPKIRASVPRWNTSTRVVYHAVTIARDWTDGTGLLKSPQDTSNVCPEKWPIGSARQRRFAAASCRTAWYLPAYILFQTCQEG
jgi:hypothetical protein